jgi:uncharacterized protein (TIGR02145 family)
MFDSLKISLINSIEIFYNMIKYLFFLILAQVIADKAFTQEYGSFKDPRDGNVYKTVKIGKQVWMAENLNTKIFSNGDSILEIKDNGFHSGTWYNFGAREKPAWCYLFNDSFYGEFYGKLYNWHAVSDPRGLAPPGWHIPSKSEWEQLVKELGGFTVAGKKMKATVGWDQLYYGTKEEINRTKGTNESGFSGKPAPERSDNGSFYGKIGPNGSWWSSTKHGSSPYRFSLSYDSPEIKYSLQGMGSGIAVRCIKD